MIATALIACLGLCWILMYGEIFIVRIPRDFLKSKVKCMNKLFTCSLCLGFWCGVAVSVFFHQTSPTSLEVVQLCLLPICSSAVCWFFDSLLDLVQESICFKEGSN